MTTWGLKTVSLSFSHPLSLDGVSLPSIPTLTTTNLLGLLAMLSSLGYPIGTLLAGLGIGGLALAFGAQKTIENLFGSVAIAVDRRVPESAAAVAHAMTTEWPRLAGRVTVVEQTIAALLAGEE